MVGVPSPTWPSAKQTFAGRRGGSASSGSPEGEEKYQSSSSLSNGPRKLIRATSPNASVQTPLRFDTDTIDFPAMSQVPGQLSL